MTATRATELVEPAEWVQPGKRLFLDTNTFLHREHEGLAELVDRCADAIWDNRSPLVVTAKVLQELRRKAATVPGRDTELVEAANSALSAIAAATKAGTVEVLGDAQTNHYADQNFEDVFRAYGGALELCVVTFDITVLLRLNVLGREVDRNLRAGTLTPEGLIYFESPQDLYERGLRKLGRSDGRDRDELSDVLPRYKAAFGCYDPVAKRPPRSSTQDSRSAAVQNGPRAFADAPLAQGPDTLMAVTFVPGAGDEIRIASATDTVTRVLGTALGDGGEGRVYEIDDATVVKIFKETRITRHRLEKVSLLIERGFTYERIAFPTGFVKNSAGEFVGYAMPKARGIEFSRAITRPERFARNFPDWKKSDLVDVCISFLKQVRYLHSQNILIGDLNPKNLLVDTNKQVWIIDADSWQFEGYPCPVGFPEFTAPEATVGALRTVQDERFAVAVVLFRILMTGCGVYDRIGAPMDDPERLNREAKFAFQLGDRSEKDQPLGPWKFMWSHLPKNGSQDRPGVKDLFWHTFHRDGDRYANRPTVDEWLGALTRFKGWLAHDFDPHSDDVYPPRLRAATEEALYECSECGCSLAGIPKREGKRIVDYHRPKRCQDCLANLPACVSCQKRYEAHSVVGGLCRNCKKTRDNEFDPERRCRDCNGLFITLKHVEWFVSRGYDVAKSHEAIKQFCPAAAASPTSTRGTRPQLADTPSVASATVRDHSGIRQAEPRTVQPAPAKKKSWRDWLFGR
ncbi:hypothetical protein [Agromyces sp. M3QZ16-3]|uniref:hypothetical protein n=1 Tax=Agromyces sp. M3QZ16-3 TaxID=3447585 RepID=UPI003F694A19